MEEHPGISVTAFYEPKAFLQWCNNTLMQTMDVLDHLNKYWPNFNSTEITCCSNEYGWISDQFSSRSKTSRGQTLYTKLVWTYAVCSSPFLKWVTFWPFDLLTATTRAYTWMYLFCYSILSSFVTSEKLNCFTSYLWVSQPWSGSFGTRFKCNL